MKKLAATVLLLLALALIIPGRPVSAQPRLLPHENPASASGATDAADLLYSLGGIMDVISTRDYRDAQEVLGELKQSVLPPELQIITDRYRSLSAEITSNCNNAESLLHGAQAAAAAGNPDEVSLLLAEARSTLDSNDYLLTELETVSQSLGEYFNILAEAGDGMIKQAYDQLNAGLESVSQMNGELQEQLNRLMAEPENEIITRFFYATSIDFTAPAAVYPGQPFTINGGITSTGSGIGRIIRVFLDGNLLTEEFVLPQFSLEMALPEQISDGRHMLTITVPEQRPYADATTRQIINVTRLPLSAEIQSPGLAVLPKTMQLSGKIQSGSGPLPDINVTITIGKKAIPVDVSADGSFTAAADLSLGYSWSGVQDIVLSVEPAEPWYETITIKRQMFVLNPLLIAGLTAAIALAAVFILRNRKRAAVYETRGEKPFLPAASADTATLTPPPRPPVKLSGNRSRIAAAYADALAKVVKNTGVMPAPGTTLREYPGMINLAPAAAGHFKDLTGLAETALYADDAVTRDTAAAAEKMAATLKKELNDGHA
ncbi:MAG: DUF4129 domain-containing protein [Dehalococcoidales bacterium]|jgi:hypothetical protein